MIITAVHSRSARAMQTDAGTSTPRLQYVAYYRVSTGRQGRFGLGLDAQREAVQNYMNGAPGKLVAEFTEVMSGRKNNRPQLSLAIRTCRIWSAVLLIARLDRLARNVGLITELIESGLQFVIADFPHANRFTIHILAAVAEYESGLMSERSKAALAVAKARGVKLGSRPGDRRLVGKGGAQAGARVRRERANARARDLAPIIWDLYVKGHSRDFIADELDRRGIPTLKRCRWYQAAITDILRRTRDEFGSTPEAKIVRALGPRSFRTAQRKKTLGPLLWGLKSAGATNEEIAAQLDEQGIAPPRRGGWRPYAVYEILKATQKDCCPGLPAAKFPLSTRPMREARSRIASIAPLIWEMRSAGLPTASIADELNRRGMRRRRAIWDGPSVARLLRSTAQDFRALADGLRPARRPSDRTQRDRSLLVLAPHMRDLIAQGYSEQEMAEALNRRGFTTERGRLWRWHTVNQTRRLLVKRGFVAHEARGAATARVLRTRQIRRAVALAQVLLPLRDAGLSYASIASELNRKGNASSQNDSWSAGTVRRLIQIAISSEHADASIRNPADET